MKNKMKDIIEFKDFEKLDLRVAEIKKADEIKGADKLYKLTIDVGELGERVICAGIKENYSKDELKGMKIVIVANLASRKLKGIESQGMLLAAVSDDHSKILLVSPGKDAEPGVKVS